MAHLGVLNVLDQHGIVADMIAGTSVGAMTGVLYSAGLDCDYLISPFAADLKLPWIFRQLPSGGYWYLLYKYRRGQFDTDAAKIPARLEVGATGRTVSRRYRRSGEWAGGCQGPGRRRRCGSRKHQLAYAFGSHLPERTGADRWRVDEYIPADVLTAQGCNFVIAVSVTAKIGRQFGATRRTRRRSEWNSVNLQTFFRTLEVQNVSLNAIGVRPAEVVIEPDVVDFDLSESMRARELFAVGEQAALDQIPKIRQLLARLDPGLFRFAQ